MASTNSFIRPLSSGVRSDPCTENYFSHLPNEIVLKIIHYLDRKTIKLSLALVNKDFNNFTKDRSLYQCYETPDFDEDGVKTLAELNHPLYRSHLKVLSTSSTSLFELDLLQFISLEKVIVNSLWHQRICLKQLSFPQSMKNIEIRNQVEYSEELLPESVAIKVDVLHICRKEHLENISSISAGRYVVDADFVFSAENLQRVKSGDLHYLLEKENISFYASYKPYDSPNVPSNAFGKLSRINLLLDCSCEIQRQTIISVCRDCSAVENLRFILPNIDKCPKIETVASKRLQTLMLSAITDTKKSDVVLKQCELLIRATRGKVTFERFKEIPFEVLSYLNSSRAALSLSQCDWCSDTTSFDERKLLRNLALEFTPAAPILQRIDPRITELDLYGFFDEYSAEVLTVLESMNSLEVFSVSYSDNSVHEVVHALLASINMLRVFKFHSLNKPDRDICQTLQLLCRFPQLQYIEIKSKEEFTTRETVKEFFSTAVVDNSLDEYGLHQLRVCL